jgi:uncharacterized membrane protein YbhN (UPF0104 family)
MQRDRSWLRPLVGLVILAVLVRHVGAGAFLEALRRLDGWSVAAGAGIAVLTTVCGAWRWVLVARGLGAELTLRSAVAESYRSQFLNVTLPGGVLGDVNRGVRHGRAGGDLGRGLRSVAWERTAGQVVLLAITAGAVVLLPSPLSSSWSAGSALATVLLVAAALAVAVLGAIVLWRRLSAPALPVRVSRAVVADLRSGLMGRHTWPGVFGSSAAVVAGHTATFVVAARAAGVTAPVAQLLPLALVVLVAMGLPLNVAGWGPREGAAAWVFGAAGLGVAGGVGTAVVYGLMAFVSSLPGAAVIALARRDRPGAAADLPVSVEGAARG